MMPVVFAIDCIGRTLFVLKGKRVKYRVVKADNGEEIVETIADCCPNNSTSTVRENVAGVDSVNFYHWAKLFVDDCKALTAQGRKVLLLSDGYRCHMRLNALHMLDQGGIIIYALPAHTSGITQPLDVGVFSPYEVHLRNLVEGLSSPMNRKGYDLFDYLRLVRVAFEKSFTSANVESGFAKSGVYPLDWRALSKTSRPLQLGNFSNLATVQQIEEMINNKRARQQESIGLQPVLL